MSEYQQRPNTGALFRNDRKEEGSNQPDMRGDLNIDGVVYELSGWTKDAKTGRRFLSLAVKRKEAKPQPAAEPSQPDDDIPF